MKRAPTGEKGLFKNYDIVAVEEYNLYHQLQVDYN